jgi:hypothetical protein
LDRPLQSVAAVAYDGGILVAASVRQAHHASLHTLK